MKPLLLVPALLVTLAAEPPSPSAFLGFPLGADRQLADYKQSSDYLRTLAKASPRLHLVDLGSTTLGQPMLMAVISSESNIKRLDHYKGIAKKLADPRGLSEAQIEALAKEGKSILLLTCSMHSTEVGASQMALEWAYDLARTKDPEMLKRLDNVILMLVPNLNPDGQNLVVDWYRKQLNTPFEGGRMPWLYHPYVGHDNNRDWWMLTQKESRAMNRAAYFEWFPQVWVDEHQMGSTG
ncbi:MAG: M14 family zinc carboxypeptidase, partial [Holophaga sp.]|nr:M14 family zinc carboxypeptidase [Holophaga sp.]